MWDRDYERGFQHWVPRVPYFKFPTTTDQQSVLEAAAKKLKRRALFTYAAPVFHKSQDLFRHMTLGTVAGNSSFPDVMSLAGHGAWYYNQPGAVGLANPDFDLLQLPSFVDQLEELVRENRNQSEQNLTPSAALNELVREPRGSQRNRRSCKRA